MRPEEAVAWFSAWLTEEGYKPDTVKGKRILVARFASYLEGLGISDICVVDRASLEGYARFIQKRISPRSGKLYRQTTQASLWGTALALLAALYEEGKIDALPAALVRVHRPRDPLVTLLSEADISRILESINDEHPRGRRDRALFELIYSAGLRAGEAARLTWEDLNLDARTAFIKQSKFDKDRVVPLTHEAIEMLKRYRDSSLSDSPFVFPGMKGGLSPAKINIRFKQYAKACELYRPGITTHQLRHACATHLIAHGAQLRYVQELLGHASVETTVRYTRNQQEEVKRIHEQYHPRETVMFKTVDAEYLRRIEELAERIREGRKKHLARLKKGGYTGGVETFLDA
jgi:integrase/recombinase XerD